MILVIRIAGQVDLPGDIKEALFRLRVRRKYTAVLIHPTPENMKLLKILRNYVAFGTIKTENLAELISKRGQPIKAGTKLDIEKIASQIDKKKLQELGLKPFFRLHPPRGGIDAKLHAGVKHGVLGDNGEKINDLVRRML